MYVIAFWFIGSYGDFVCFFFTGDTFSLLRKIGGRCSEGLFEGLEFGDVLFLLLLRL